MGPQAYPLEAARTLRARAEDDARDALALAVGAHELAQRRTADAREAHAAHARDSARLREEDRARDAERRTAQSMQHAHAFAMRRREELATLAQRILEAERAERDAARAADEARAALATARAEREAVEKHYVKWLEERKKKDEARAEAETEDVLAGRRR